MSARETNHLRSNRERTMNQAIALAIALEAEFNSYRAYVLLGVNRTRQQWLRYSLIIHSANA